jgi:ribonuclease Z
MSQRKLSARSIEEIFLTGPINWHTTGGLLGMILTIGDAAATARASIEEANEKRAAKGKKEVKGSFSALNIHGTKNLTHLLATARKFVFRKGMPLRPHEITEDIRASRAQAVEADWEDDCFRVWYVPVAHKPLASRKRSHDAISEPGTLAADGSTTIDETVLSRNEEADQEARLNVVKNMFDSDWRLDALQEVKLKDVKLPATIFIRDERGHIVPWEGKVPGGGEPNPDLKVLVRTPWPSAMINTLPSTKPSLESLCYVVKTQPRRGKFNPVEAKKLGVAPQDFGSLTKGFSVIGKDGKKVLPEMVMGATIAGRGFAVVDLPSPAYIEAFLARPEWSNFEIMSNVDAFYWIVGDNIVLEDDRIQIFMKQRSAVRHIALPLAAGPNYLAMEGAAVEAIKLNRIDPERFPIPIFNNASSLPAKSASQLGQAGATLQLAPNLIFQDDKAIPALDTTAAMKEMEAQADVIALADAARAKISDASFLADVEVAEKDSPHREVEIVSLGTGSALPSKYRNVSATLVRVPGVGSYLLDCGENTIGQLRRAYGFAGADDIIRDLRGIWISHQHADHHLGTVSIIKRYRDLVLGPLPTSDPAKAAGARQLAVIAHAAYHEWLIEYGEVEAFGLDLVTHLVMDGAHRNATMDSPLPAAKTMLSSAQVLAPFGLSRVETCFVDHCHGALAIALTFTTGLKVAYSGDCRPSPDRFGTIGRDADLLVHECTFDDDLAGDALAKKHCTLSEAIDVARAMAAKKVLLTHFSQRYPKIPVFKVDDDKTDENSAQAKPDFPVLFAFDYMRVKLGEFRMAEAFLPALQKLYEGQERV